MCQISIGRAGSGLVHLLLMWLLILYLLLLSIAIERVAWNGFFWVRIVHVVTVSVSPPPRLGHWCRRMLMLLVLLI